MLKWHYGTNLRPKQGFGLGLGLKLSASIIHSRAIRPKLFDVMTWNHFITSNSKLSVKYDFDFSL